MDQNSNVITLNPEAPVILGHTGNSMSLFVILVYKNSVEFRYRDAVLTTILGGTTEMHKLTIGRELLRINTLL